MLQPSRLRLQALLRLEAAQTVGGQRPHAGATGGVTVWKQRDSEQVRGEEPVESQSHERASLWDESHVSGSSQGTSKQADDAAPLLPECVDNGATLPRRPASAE